MSNEASDTSIKLFGIFIAARVVGFLGLVYFTKVLSKELLGVYFLFFLIVQVASLVSNLGLQQALVTKIGEGKREDAAFSAGLVVLTVVSLVITAVVHLFDTPIANYVGADVPLLISVATASWLFSGLYKDGLQAEDRIFEYGLLQLTEDILRVGIGAAFITVGFGPRGLMYGVIGGFLGTALIGAVLSDLSITLPEVHDFKRIFSVSRYTMFYGPTNFAYFWLDTYMIGLLIGQAAVSSYEVAWQTTRVLIIATTAISSTIFPKISRWAADENYAEIENVLSGTILFTLMFPIPGLVGLAVLAPEVLALVYTPAYLDAVVPLILLSGYMVVEAVQRVSNPVLTAIDRPDVPFKTRIFGVTTAVVLNVLLIPQIGLIGAAIATLVSKSLDTAIQWATLFSLLNVSLPLRSLGWLCGSALIMGVVVYGALIAFDPQSIAGLFCLVGLGTATYGLLVLRNDDVNAVVDRYIPFELPM